MLSRSKLWITGLALLTLTSIGSATSRAQDVKPRSDLEYRRHSLNLVLAQEIDEEIYSTPKTEYREQNLFYMSLKPKKSKYADSKILMLR